MGGLFILSLDFELIWGLRDMVCDRPRHEKLVLQGRRAIPRILQLLATYGVKATWATVGMVLVNGKKEWLELVPSRLPAYHDPRLNPYEEAHLLGPSEAHDPLHFAPSLARLIVSTPGQELASHTYSHYYCLEPGADPESFQADLASAKEAARRLDLKIHSLVLPRNQATPWALKVLASAGIKAWRGNQKGWMYRPLPGAKAGTLERPARLIDAYLPLSGWGIYPLPHSRAPVNLPASRFMRLPRELTPGTGMMLTRITAAMTRAAERGWVYHLWCHPHNFGRAPRRALFFLEQVLRHFRRLNQKLGMQSLTMAEAAAIATGERLK